MKLKDFPNILSAIRILLVPLFAYLYMTERLISAVVVFVVAGLTDIADGYIARKYECISNIGKVLDPLADKLMQFCAFVCLTISDTIPLWMPIVYFVKEISTLIGALFVFKKVKTVVKSHIFGKLATFFVFAFVSVLIVLPDLFSDSAVTVICVVMCMYFVFSNLMYVKTEIRGEVGKTGGKADAVTK